MTYKSGDHGHVEKVFTNLRRTLNRTENDDVRPEDQRIDLGTIYVNKDETADHLGLECDQIVIAYQDTNFEGIKTLFDVSLRPNAENSFEILSVSTMMCGV